MGTVGAGFSLSPDGFIAGTNDDETRIFAWMFAGPNGLKIPTGDHDIDLKERTKARLFPAAGCST